MRPFIAALLAILLAVAVAPWGTGRAQDKDPTQRDLDAYKIRVDDRIEVVVHQFEEFNRQVLVPANGVVSFPPVGKLRLLDKTVFEVEEQVKARLQELDIAKQPIVTCIVTDYAKRYAYLIGAAQGTVELPTHKNVRVLELLARFGNLGNQNADFSQVTVRRMGKDGTPYKFKINVRDILERGKEEQNIVVYEDDMIYVAALQPQNPIASDWVYVLGEVGSPGRHPIIQGRTPFTLTKLIAIVGDFKEFGDRNRITIIRTTATGRRFIPIDFDDIIEGNAPDFELEADDLVYVPETWI